MMNLVGGVFRDRTMCGRLLLLTALMTAAFGLLVASGGAALLATVHATTSLWVLVGGTLALGLCSVAMPAMSSLAVGSAPG